MNARFEALIARAEALPSSGAGWRDIVAEALGLPPAQKRRVHAAIMEATGLIRGDITGHEAQIIGHHNRGAN